MEFKTKSAKPQKSRVIENEPTMEVEDPSRMYENNTGNFVPDGELEFLMREKTRAKLQALKSEGTRMTISLSQTAVTSRRRQELF